MKVENSGPRATQSVMSRIRQGNVGAIILLESFVGHSVTDAAVQACVASGIPWAYGARAGVGNLTSALTILERKAQDVLQ